MAILGTAPLLTVEDLEDCLGAVRFPAFVEAGEADFYAQVQKIAETAAEHAEIRFIFISGPTSSGKTTFTARLRSRLETLGRKAYQASMDDYYFEGVQRYDEEGRPDLESLDTVELELLLADLKRLEAGESLILPCFDFKGRKREYLEERRLCLRKGDLLLIEGLHGLASAVLNGLQREHYLGVFIMPNGRFINDQRVLAPADIRKLRRISRDVRHRDTAALATLDYWPMIEKVEKQFVSEYLERADFYVNSFLPYELLVTAPLADRELRHSQDLYMRGELPPSRNVRPGLFYADLNRAIREARRLSQACAMLPEADSRIVPETSILQEFI